MSNQCLIDGVRVVDLPDLGALTNSSSVVGEHAGSGRFSAAALASYVGAGMHVRNFGAVGDGVTDDSAAINAAIAAAAAAGVGAVNFDARRYAIANTIILGNGTTALPSTINGVSLVGVGSQFVRLGLTGNLGDVGTQLVWTGAVGGTMATIRGPCFGIDLRHIALDCNNRAANGLYIVSGSQGQFPNLSIANYSGFGLFLTTQPVAVLTGGTFDNAILGTEGNSFTALRLLSLAPSSIALELNGYLGDGTNVGFDSVRNFFTDVYILMSNNSNSVGIELAYCDQNVFNGFTCTRIGTPDSTAPTIRLTASHTNPFGWEFPETISFIGTTDIGQNGFVQMPSATPIGPGFVMDNMTTLDQQNIIRAPENEYIRFSAVEPGLFPSGGFWSDGGLNVNERGLRNKLMNASMARATRGASVTATANRQYSLDGYKVLCDGTFSVNVNRLSFTPGQTDVPYGPRYFLRFSPTAVSGASYLELAMPVPDVALLAGRTTVFSVWMSQSSGSGAQAGAAAYQSFGAGGSAGVATQSGNTFTLSSVWKRYAYLIQMPSIAGKTLAADGRHWVEISLGFPVSAGYSIDIAMPQWEAGPVDTAFEIRPDAVDETMCGRFLRRAGMGMAGGVFSATGIEVGGGWPAMWATPTASLIGGTISISVPGDNVYGAGAPTANVRSISATGGVFDVSGFTGLTVFRPVLAISDFLTVSAEV